MLRRGVYAADKETAQTDFCVKVIGFMQIFYDFTEVSACVAVKSFGVAVFEVPQKQIGKRNKLVKQFFGKSSAGFYRGVYSFFFCETEKFEESIRLKRRFAARNGDDGCFSAAGCIDSVIVRQQIVSPAEGEYVLLLNSDTYLTGNAIYKRFSRLLEAAGVPHIRFHDLRHLNASTMVALNVPDVYAMERGGWSSPSIMKSVYQHTLTEERRSVDEKIDGYFENILEKIKG